MLSVSEAKMAAPKLESSGLSNKFDGNNYRLWECQLLNLLGAHELLDVADGTTFRPTADADKILAYDRQRDANEEIKAFMAVNIQEINWIMRDDTTNVWTVDSGSNVHVTSRRDWLVNFKEETGATLTVGGGCRLPVLGKGHVNILAHANSERIPMKNRKMLYVSELGDNLLSVNKCVDNGMRPEVHGNAFSFTME
ncbi:hypothetical protein KM043_016487 [Ampulex compressa]|nr:hypothetical protein KM043_016487 [Ampulex compressa]